jgi:hypothetical protein
VHSDRNPIFLRISQDEGYEANLAAHGTQGFARHGGLRFRFDDKNRWVQSIESALLVAGIRYEFWVQLRYVSKLELNLRFADLIRTVRANFQ